MWHKAIRDLEKMYKIICKLDNICYLLNANSFPSIIKLKRDIKAILTMLLFSG